MAAFTLIRAGGIALLVTLAACATHGDRNAGTRVRGDAVTRSSDRQAARPRARRVRSATPLADPARPQIVQRTPGPSTGLVRQTAADADAKPIVRPHRGPAQAWHLPDGTVERDWRSIVIHHSGTNAGNAAQFDKRHREVNGWDGLAYQFVIGNGRGAADGKIEIGFRWWNQREGAHAGNTEANEHGIGICVIGNFHTRTGVPTAAQWASLIALVRDLQDRYGIATSAIVGHQDVRDAARGRTECPGQYFPWARLRADISR